MANSMRGTSARWAKIRDAQKSRRLPCNLCGQPIDYSLKWPHPQSFSADHIRPYEHNPDLRLDPGNVQSSHLRCNQSKGDNQHYSAGMGSASQVF